MKTIKSLTTEQQEQLSVYRDQWLEIGLSTTTNTSLAEKAVDDVYKNAELNPPPVKIWLQSPYLGVHGAYLLAQVWDQVGAQVRVQVWEQVGAQVRAQVWEQVRVQVWDQVGAQVWEQVGAQVGAQVNKCGYGSHDANWLGFYQYFQQVCDLKCVDKLNGLIALSRHCGWFWPFEGAVILTPKPIALYRDESHQLHSEKGMALQYPDGWGIHALHGVRVEPWMAETPSESLEPKKVLTITNAEQRAAVMRRVGVERLLSHIPKRVLDRVGDYELLSVNLEGLANDARYLKMRNPSVGIYHVEGVHPDCKTVQQAINWRAGNINEEWKPKVLT